MQCDWFLEGTFHFKGGFKFKGKYGWSSERESDKALDVEQTVKNQMNYNGKFVEPWEVELQRKRLSQISMKKKMFQTNDLRGLTRKISGTVVH